jgi:hypothetical protein
MAKGHPLAAQRQLSLRQVVAYPLGLPQEDSSIRRCSTPAARGKACAMHRPCRATMRMRC